MRGQAAGDAHLGLEGLEPADEGAASASHAGGMGQFVELGRYRLEVRNREDSVAENTG
jgi:hypothetical protein